MAWRQRWNVRGSNGAVWTVALSTEGTWGCSCPKWKFAKKGADGLKPDCHHIGAVRSNVERADRYERADVERARRYAEQMEQARRFGEGQRPENRLPMQGERRLDLDEGVRGWDQDEPLPSAGERFRHLDYEIEAIA